MSDCSSRELRALVVEMVLATDMSCHFQQVKAMKNFLQQPEGSVSPPITHKKASFQLLWTFRAFYTTERYKKLHFASNQNSNIIHHGIGLYRRVWIQPPRHKHKTACSLWISSRSMIQTLDIHFLGTFADMQKYIWITSSAPRITHSVFFYLIGKTNTKYTKNTNQMFWRIIGPLFLHSF